MKFNVYYNCIKIEKENSLASKQDYTWLFYFPYFSFLFLKSAVLF